MANKYLISQRLLDQIKRDHDKTERIKNNTLPKYGVQRTERLLAKITGKYTTAGVYPLEATYKAVQVITDSSGDFVTFSGGQTWGVDSTSYPPVVDIVSIGPYFNKTINKRIPNDTIVEVFCRGNKNGDIIWYCEAPEQKVPISFQADFIYESSGATFIDKILINAGTVFGKSFSTNIPEQKFVISQNLFIYVTYIISFDDYTVSSIGLGTSSGRPTEVADTSTYREVKIPIVSFANDSTLKMTRYHEGDIFVDDNWYDGTNSALDLTYDNEHTESALTDSGWERNDQGSYSGVQLTVQTGMSYYDSGDEIIYGYFRDLIFDQEGKLVEITTEVRVAIETPETCP